MLSSSRRNAPPRHEPAYLVPSEVSLAVQTIALVVFSAWFFGGTLDWAQAWILAIIGLGGFALRMRSLETGRWDFRPFIPAALWAAFATIACLNPSHALLPGGGWSPREEMVRWLPSTVDTAHTLADAGLWLPALLQGGLIAGILRTRRAANAIWTAIALNGFALAAIGAGFHFAGADKLLGLVEGQEPTYFFATFFYKNHWAAYGALSAAAAFTLAYRAWPAAVGGDPRARGQTLLFGGAGVLTTTTLPLPGSRAGALLALALVVGFVLAMLASWWRTTRATGARSRWMLGALALAITSVLFFGLRAYAPRAGTDLERTRQQVRRSLDGEALDIRIPVSRDTWRMTLERPWFGWGPGCFEIVFPRFQGNYLRGPDGKATARFEAAHNDWLQLTAETGFLGASLLLVPVTIAGWRGWRRSDASGRHGLAACGLIAAYAWIDFPFHNRAILLVWSIMLMSAHRLAPRSSDIRS